ncbi:MAG: alpha-E domain-containing protein [Bacteroidales bacterium]|nr:alpha-E domain-containing protein [Bacteroidales bacterium]
MTTTVCNAISATKANRLYWLGRYAERVYLSLHLLRKSYDTMIDGAGQGYLDYYKRLDASSVYPDKLSFMLGYMYDEKNPNSLLSGIERANDNAIVLREEIMSETLSYIQLSLVRLKEAAAAGTTNITDLQCITDYLLAFWGSAEERIYDDTIRALMRIGRLVENIDMHLRFDYPFYRVKESFESLKRCAEDLEGIFDTMILAHVDELLTEEEYCPENLEYKFMLLKYVNHLVLL